MARHQKIEPAGQPDLFSSGAEPQVRHQLAMFSWAQPGRLLVNHAASKVRDFVWADLVESRRALVVAGFASIAKLVELVAARTNSGTGGQVDLLLGSEPFGTDRINFGSASAVFTAEVRRFWMEERGVSIRLSAKIVQAMIAIEQGWFRVRFMPGATRLHAKIYVGDSAVTVGSSNFTNAGLSTQFEANVRFERAKEAPRYTEAAVAAENYWQVGQDWSQELRALLADLLQFVPWEDALARACADLLEGQWAERYLGTHPSLSTLWPSQIAGIAQAMWVVENVGSVLVADATGSGKTRMGAHLVRAVRHRLWNTGRVRDDLTVLVCPPSVETQWLRESAACGLTMRTVSQGRLSLTASAGDALPGEEVRKAQILVVDEAHNYLGKDSERTRQLRQATADHILLFTATPINRGAADLLSLIDHLGADNFEDETLELLDQLTRRGRADTAVLTLGQRDLLRREIQRFTVRRTKAALNEMIEQDPDAYRHPVTNRVCRYPAHQPRVYATGETAADQQLATGIREHARTLRGVSLLGTVLAVPATLRAEFTDQRWIEMRLAAAAGLAEHHVVAAMRSSTAALLEHLVGTETAIIARGIENLIKPQSTGAIIDKVVALREQGPPRLDLRCSSPLWLRDREAWQAECEREIAAYESIARAANALSNARERAKAQLIASLTPSHQRILAFDRHPISLAAIRGFINSRGVDIITASGAATSARKAVRNRFTAESLEPCIALCTDAMSEGLNLQGASAIVHLDLPTTLRVAEQRVGRVDRMDSPYDVIEAWWPDDTEAFATSANELLTARNDESASLLGSNLPIPNLTSSRATRAGDLPVDTSRFVQNFETPEAEVWDGIQDALDPVRRLVDGGPEALLTSVEYARYRHASSRVLARISPVQSTEPWAFFAARGHLHGPPRWILIDGSGPTVIHGLDRVTTGLRARLAERPPSRGFDPDCERWLSDFLDVAAKAESDLIPRRLQRALHQMNNTCRVWAAQARTRQDEDIASRWEAIARLADPADGELLVDPHQVAERWLELVQPLRNQARTRLKANRYSKLTDIDESLRDKPLVLHDVETHLRDLHQLEPFDQRISACIVGVPLSAQPSAP